MIDYKPIVQRLTIHKGVTVDVLRLDLLHSNVSGNKWFKLKYNIEETRKKNCKGILTFGGAHSNHIASTAAACKISGLSSIAFIRGEQSSELTPTLIFARSQGMEIEFLSREKYREKSSADFNQTLQTLYPDYWIVPEGGTNEQGIRGCSEILTPALDHDYIFCACGTAATYTGLVLAAQDYQVVLGINVLKGNNDLVAGVNENLKKFGSLKRVKGNEGLSGTKLRHFMTDQFAFKGYATYNEDLIAFKKEFEAQYNITLDHVYTVKVFFGAFNLIDEGRISGGSRVLLIHTGGLQGNAAFEKRYAQHLNAGRSGPEPQP